MIFIDLKIVKFIIRFFAQIVLNFNKFVLFTKNNNIFPSKCVRNLLYKLI